MTTLNKKKFIYLLLISIVVMFTTVAILFMFIGIPPFITRFAPAILNDPITLITIFLLAIIVTSIGGIITFSSDNEYLMVIGVIIMLLGITMATTSIPRLVDIAYRSLSEYFNNFMKRIANMS